VQRADARVSPASPRDRDGVGWPQVLWLMGGSPVLRLCSGGPRWACGSGPAGLLTGFAACDSSYAGGCRLYHCLGVGTGMDRAREGGVARASYVGFGASDSDEQSTVGYSLPVEFGWPSPSRDNPHSDSLNPRNAGHSMIIRAKATTASIEGQGSFLRPHAQLPANAVED